jgi:hypothetical protein
VEPGPVSTLSGVATITASEPVQLGIAAVAEDHEVRIPPPAEPAATYELPLVGLRPDTTYDVRIDGSGESDGAVEFATGSLPEDFPPLDLAIDRQRATPGLTLLSLKPWADPGSDAPGPLTGGYLAAVDDEGFVVWYHPTELGILDAHQVPGGDFLFTYDELAVRRIDVLGRPTGELAGRIAMEISPEDLFGNPRTTDAAVRIDTDSVHHDAGLTDRGTILLLSTEVRELSGPPQCGEGGDQATYSIIADVIVEVEQATGEILGEWRLLDVFDPFERPGSELCIQGAPFAPPNIFYNGGGVDVRDWTHGNSVVLDEARNALIVSLRHFSSVVAIRYADDDEGPAGELLWELGLDGTVPIEGEPPSYQHAAEVLEDGSILVYDNGNQRTAGAQRSRGVIYELDGSGTDPGSLAARQVWEHVLADGDSEVFTAFLGDADALPDGRVLLTYGAIGDIGTGFTARIVEVDRADGEEVYDLTVGDAESSWTVYRSQRIAGLVPEP